MEDCASNLYFMVTMADDWVNKSLFRLWILANEPRKMLQLSGEIYKANLFLLRCLYLVTKDL